MWFWRSLCLTEHGIFLFIPALIASAGWHTYAFIHFTSTALLFPAGCLMLFPSLLVFPGVCNRHAMGWKNGDNLKEDVSRRTASLGFSAFFWGGLQKNAKVTKGKEESGADSPHSERGLVQGFDPVYGIGEAVSGTWRGR